jgi:hypothetical protein
MTAGDGTTGSWRSGWTVRIEDWLLAAWVAVAAPILVRGQASSAGPFDGGRPMDGLIDLIAILGAFACLASRNPDAAEGSSITGGAAIGPFTGGLILIAVSAAAALQIGSDAAVALLIAIVAVAVIVRVRWHVLPTLVRRALITPYILVAGSLFWRAINGLTDAVGMSSLRAVAPADLGAVAPLVGFLLAFSVVYYAMLVYAPRQVAEREGGALAWIVRYALFVVGIALGAGWLAAVGG